MTNGVAQGCVLSPLLFTIYIDDLLKRFRESGLGVPLGALLVNALSFADDLLLVSPDHKTTKQYLTILEQWAIDNGLSINGLKSGILRCGSVRNELPERFYLNQTPLLYLEEEDPLSDEVKRFEYLGITLPPDGKWDRQIDARCPKLGRRWAATTHSFTTPQYRSI